MKENKENSDLYFKQHRNIKVFYTLIFKRFLLHFSALKFIEQHHQILCFSAAHSIMLMESKLFKHPYQLVC